MVTLDESTMLKRLQQVAKAREDVNKAQAMYDGAMMVLKEDESDRREAASDLQAAQYRFDRISRAYDESSKTVARYLEALRQEQRTLQAIIAIQR